VAILAVSVAGCGWLADPPRTCVQQAAEYGPDFSVAGAFATTASRVRSLYPTASEVLPETDGADGETVVLCYLDGELPKGPPPAGDEIPPSYDRVVVAVLNEMGTPLVMGYQVDIQVTDPNE